jgi:galactokinase
VEENVHRLKVMLEKVEEVFGHKREGESWDEILNGRLGGMSREVFEGEFQGGFEIEAQRLKLYKRAKHHVRHSLPLFLAPQDADRTPRNWNFP